MSGSSILDVHQFWCRLRVSPHKSWCCDCFKCQLCSWSWIMYLLLWRLTCESTMKYHAGVVWKWRHGGCSLRRRTTSTAPDADHKSLVAACGFEEWPWTDRLAFVRGWSQCERHLDPKDLLGKARLQVCKCVRTAWTADVEIIWNYMNEVDSFFSNSNSLYNLYSPVAFPSMDDPSSWILSGGGSHISSLWGLRM